MRHQHRGDAVHLDSHPPEDVVLGRRQLRTVDRRTREYDVIETPSGIVLRVERMPVDLRTLVEVGRLADILAHDVHRLGLRGIGHDLTDRTGALQLVGLGVVLILHVFDRIVGRHLDVHLLVAPDFKQHGVLLDQERAGRLGNDHLVIAVEKHLREGSVDIDVHADGLLQLPVALLPQLDVDFVVAETELFAVVENTAGEARFGFVVVVVFARGERQRQCAYRKIYYLFHDLELFFVTDWAA